MQHTWSLVGLTEGVEWDSWGLLLPPQGLSSSSWRSKIPSCMDLSLFLSDQGSLSQGLLGGKRSHLKLLLKGAGLLSEGDLDSLETLSLSSGFLTTSIAQCCDLLTGSGSPYHPQLKKGTWNKALKVYLKPQIRELVDVTSRHVPEVWWQVQSAILHIPLSSLCHQLGSQQSLDPGSACLHQFPSISRRPLLWQPWEGREVFRLTLLLWVSSLDLWS